MKTLLTFFVLFFSSVVISQDIKITNLENKNYDNDMDDLTGKNIFCKKTIIKKNNIDNIIMLSISFINDRDAVFKIFKSSNKNNKITENYRKYNTTLMTINVYVTDSSYNFTIDRRNLNINSTSPILSFKGENCLTTDEDVDLFFKKSIEEELNKNLL